MEHILRKNSAGQISGGETLPADTVKRKNSTGQALPRKKKQPRDEVTGEGVPSPERARLVKRSSPRTLSRSQKGQPDSGSTSPTLDRNKKSPNQIRKDIPGRPGSGRSQSPVGSPKTRRNSKSRSPHLLRRNSDTGSSSPELTGTSPFHRRKPPSRSSTKAKKVDPLFVSPSLPSNIAPIPSQSELVLSKKSKDEDATKTSSKENYPEVENENDSDETEIEETDTRDETDNKKENTDDTKGKKKNKTTFLFWSSTYSNRFDLRDNNAINSINYNNFKEKKTEQSNPPKVMFTQSCPHITCTTHHHNDIAISAGKIYKKYFERDTGMKMKQNFLDDIKNRLAEGRVSVEIFDEVCSLLLIWSDCT